MISGSDRRRATAGAALLTFALTPPSLAAAADPCHWQVSSIESGGPFNTTQFISKTTAFAEDGDCVWRSGDGGRNWQRLPCNSQKKDNADSIEQLQFIDATEGWMVQGQVLMHTRDGGATWTRQSFPRYVIRSVRFLDRAHGWWVGEESPGGVANYRGAVFATRDGGETWSAQDLGVRLHGRWRLEDMWPISASDVWVTGDALLHSTDGGKSWSAVADRAPALMALRNVVIRFADTRIGWIRRMPPENFLVTTDGGATWHARHPPRRGVLDSLVFITAADAWASASDVYHSADGGRHWTESLSGQQEDGSRLYYAVQYLPQDRQLVAISGKTVASCALP